MPSYRLIKFVIKPEGVSGLKDGLRHLHCAFTFVRVVRVLVLYTLNISPISAVTESSMLTIEIFRKRAWHIHNDGAVSIGRFEGKVVSLLTSSSHQAGNHLQLLTPSRYIVT